MAAPPVRTTLVNDPAHPFTARQLASMQAWLDRSAEPTPAVLYVHRGQCPTAVACANTNYEPAYDGWVDEPGHVWIDGWRALHDRSSFMHEAFHVLERLAYTDADRAVIERDLHMRGP
jgi:hypothetical protein